MALPDDLKQLAQQDVIYLTTIIQVDGALPLPTTVYRGRLHQALSGNWVFNTSTGQNGVAGIDLGPQTPEWSSAETPAGGLQVTITYAMLKTPTAAVNRVTLTNVIPTDLAD